MKILKIVLISFVLWIYPSAGENNGGCYAEVDNIDFGNYNPFEPVIKRTYTTLQVICNTQNRVAFTIRLIGGNSNNPGRRFLFSPSTEGKLYYNLFYRGCIWGDGTQNTCVISGITRSKRNLFSNKSFTIVGIIPPMQNVPVANDYQDHLTVIVEY